MQSFVNELGRVIELPEVPEHQHWKVTVQEPDFYDSEGRHKLVVTLVERIPTPPSLISEPKRSPVVPVKRRWWQRPIEPTHDSYVEPLGAHHIEEPDEDAALDNFYERRIQSAWVDFEDNDRTVTEALILKGAHRILDNIASHADWLGKVKLQALKDEQKRLEDRKMLGLYSPLEE
jgi:hypothetical protein